MAINLNKTILCSAAMAMLGGTAMAESTADMLARNIWGGTSSGGPFAFAIEGIEVDVPAPEALMLKDGLELPGIEFITFCIERNEVVRPGFRYDVAENTEAIKGGLGGGNPDPLSPETAFLYTHFYQGTLPSIVPTFEYLVRESGWALQDAIYMLEDEGRLFEDPASEVYLLAEELIAAAQASGWTDIGGVRVLNMTNQRTIMDPDDPAAGNGRDHQDVLILAGCAADDEAPEVVCEVTPIDPDTPEYRCDINGDGTVNYHDVWAFKKAWYRCEIDFNNDGKYDFKDWCDFVECYHEAQRQQRDARNDGQLLELTFSAEDNCSLETVMAYVETECGQVAVESGDVVEIVPLAKPYWSRYRRCWMKPECKIIETDEGVKIIADSAVFTVIATDASGNASSCETELLDLVDRDDNGKKDRKCGRSRRSHRGWWGHGCR